MDARAQNIATQVGNLTTSFGTNVTVTRTSSATQFDIYGNPQDGQVSTFTVRIIVESVKPMLLQTLAGGKPKVQLKAIAQSGVLKAGDELVYSGRTYKVLAAEPVNFAGDDVVNFITAEGEVND